jgi:hypothetical protein
MIQTLGELKVFLGNTISKRNLFPNMEGSVLVESFGFEESMKKIAHAQRSGFSQKWI